MSGQAKALSDTDILKITGGRCKILPYEDLAKYSTIEEAIGPKKAAALLYPIGSTTDGHWCALILHPNGEIEVFDPYGAALDHELTWNKIGFRDKLLTQKLGGERVEHNTCHDQALKNGVNTCGRWSSLRIKLRDLSLKEFNQWVAAVAKEQGISKDQVVTDYTNKLLR